MKIHPANNIEIGSAHNTQSSTLISSFSVDIRNISWQPVLTAIFLFENYALQIAILVRWYSYVALICIPFSFIPFAMIVKCIKSSWILPQDLIRNSKKQKYLNVVQGKLQHMKQCPKCNVFTNSRIIHCRRCNGCHLGYDHFCAWLNCCIHIVNYRYFLYFIFSSCFLFLLILIGNICNFIFLKDEIVIILNSISFAQSILSLIYTLYVCIFHIYLIHHGISTKQFFLKYRNQSSKFWKMLCHDVDTQTYMFQSQVEQVQEQSLTEFEQSLYNSPSKRLKKCMSNSSVNTRF